MAIIGRKKEIKEFNELYNSGKAELVAVYGRRRVGKTFLIDETLAGGSVLLVLAALCEGADETVDRLLEG